jgi:hypothetical protein
VVHVAICLACTVASCSARISPEAAKLSVRANCRPCCTVHCADVLSVALGLAKHWTFLSLYSIAQAIYMELLYACSCDVFVMFLMTRLFCVRASPYEPLVAA